MLDDKIMADKAEKRELAARQEALRIADKLESYECARREEELGMNDRAEFAEYARRQEALRRADKFERREHAARQEALRMTDKNEYDPRGLRKPEYTFAEGELKRRNPFRWAYRGKDGKEYLKEEDLAELLRLESIAIRSVPYITPQPSMRMPISFEKAQRNYKRRMCVNIPKKSF